MTIYYFFMYYVIMETEEKQMDNLVKRLDVVIALLATIATKDENITLRDKIIMLNSFGLKPAEIATVLNKKANYVSKELSIARGKK